MKLPGRAAGAPKKAVARRKAAVDASARPVRVGVLEGPLLMQWLCAETALTWTLVTVLAVVGAFGEHRLAWFFAGCLLLPVAVHFSLRGRFAVRFDDRGITVVRPWGRRRATWAQTDGLRFRRLPVGEDDVARWAVTVSAGASQLPLATVAETPAPDAVIRRRHGRLFAPFADRGLGVLGLAEGDAAREYFDQAVRTVRE